MPAGDLRGRNPAFRYASYLAVGKACVEITVTLPTATIAVTKPDATIEIEACNP